MSRPTRTENWAGGANNIAKPDRLPGGHVRQLVNLDASADGALSLRAGFEQVFEGDNVRGAGLAGDKILIVDDNGLTAFDARTGASAPVGGTIGPGPLACVTHNQQLYMTTPAQTWRYDGDALKQWGIAEPAVSFDVIPGPLTGQVKVAVTALGDDGEESGCEPYLFSLNNEAITVTSNDPRTLLFYASPPNHQALYRQARGAGPVTLTQVRDETERLTTAGLVPYPACALLCSHHGMIVGASDRFVVCSEPFMPHLYDPVQRFFVYDSPVTMLAATEGGVFVGTDHATYFVSALESAPAQRRVLDYGAVQGTGFNLPDGRAAWFTHYGQAIGNLDGTVALINDDRLAPEIATQGSAGIVEHNGNRMLVTTMRGPVRSAGLGIAFQHDLET